METGNEAREINIFFYIAAGKKSVRQLQRLYLKMKEDVFGGSGEGLLGKGNAAKLESALRNWVGEDSMDKVKHPK